MVVLACGSNALQQLATDDRVVLSDIACLDDAVSLEAASWSQAVTQAPSGRRVIRGLPPGAELPSVAVSRWLGHEEFVAALLEDGRVQQLSDGACSEGRYRLAELNGRGELLVVPVDGHEEAHLYASLDAFLWSPASFLRLALPSNGALPTGTASISHTLPAPIIQAVASGAAHFLFLTSIPSPQVFSYGDSRYGQSGPFASSSCVPFPADTPSAVSLNHLEHFDGLFPAEVACGAFHSAVRTRDGSVYVFGSNKEGQLGVLTEEVGGGGGEPELLELPDEADDEGDEVRQVACGAHHTVVLQRSGRVWLAGLNDEGQLGLGDTQSRQVLVRNHAAEQMARSSGITVSRIVCSRSNTFFELSPSSKPQH